MNEIVAMIGTREFLGLVVGLLVAAYAIRDSHSHTSNTRLSILLAAALVIGFLIAYSSTITKGEFPLFSFERKIQEARELIDNFAREGVAKIEQELKTQKEDLQKQQKALDEQRDKIESVIKEAKKLGRSLAWKDISYDTSPFDAQNFEYSFIERDRSNRYWFATYIDRNSIGSMWSGGNNIVVNSGNKRRAIVDRSHPMDVITYSRPRGWSE